MGESSDHAPDFSAAKSPSVNSVSFYTLESNAEIVSQSSYLALSTRILFAFARSFDA